MVHFQHVVFSQHSHLVAHLKKTLASFLISEIGFKPSIESPYFLTGMQDISGRKSVACGFSDVCTDVPGVPVRKTLFCETHCKIIAVPENRIKNVMRKSMIFF